jgi:arginine repressor
VLCLVPGEEHVRDLVRHQFKFKKPTTVTARLLKHLVTYLRESNDELVIKVLIGMAQAIKTDKLWKAISKVSP